MEDKSKEFRSQGMDLKERKEKQRGDNLFVLVRSMYCDGSLLILDDVLAALDSHVQRKMMTHVKAECTKRNKLVLFGKAKEQIECF